MMIIAPRTCIWVVSLDDAHERRSGFTQRAGGSTVSWQFFNAHRGIGPHLFYNPATALHVHGRELQPGELGCYSSHSALWEALLKDTAWDQYIILEDDVIVDWQALAIVGAHDFTACGHHYVRLYGRKPAPFAQIDANYLPQPRALIQFLGKPFGTQAYVITRQGAAQLLAACRTVMRPIDDQMDRFWEHGIPNLALFPFPVIEQSASSTIGAGRYERKRRGRSARAQWRDRWAMRWAGWRIRAGMLGHRLRHKIASR